VHYLLFYGVVDDFVTKRVKVRQLHLEHVRSAYERGDLMLAGALAEPSDGAVLLFRGPNSRSAECFAKSDPYVTNGLVSSWRVRKWMTVIGEGSDPPAN
jgi:uncharacterized protein YciI